MSGGESGDQLVKNDRGSGEVKRSSLTGRTLLSDDDHKAREFLSEACHDLVAPLNAIKLIAQGLLWRLRRGEAVGDTKLTEVFSRIDDLAHEGIRLADDVLAVDRLRVGDGAREPIDVEASFTEAVKLQSEALRRAGCPIFLTREEGLGRVWGRWDRRALRSLFSNLLQNVSRYAAGAPVNVHLSRTLDRLRIRFSDNGPGLPLGFGDGRPRPSPQGHGLGFWIIHRAVADLGGEIEIASAPDRGLTFDIRLPL
jgi:signal transduction histidine kinase